MSGIQYSHNHIFGPSGIERNTLFQDLHIPSHQCIDRSRYIRHGGRSRWQSRATIGIEKRSSSDQPVGHRGDELQTRLRQLFKMSLKIGKGHWRRISYIGINMACMKEEGHERLLAVQSKNK